MLHHNPTKPDKTGQPLQMCGPTHAKPTLRLQAATALAHFMYCHEMAPNGTNMRSHQELVTSPVTNNGPLTRIIRFVTALSFILTALSPLMGFVTKRGLTTHVGASGATLAPDFWWNHVKVVGVVSLGSPVYTIPNALRFAFCVLRFYPKERP
jgi:hypothetical protein